MSERQFELNVFEMARDLASCERCADVMQGQLDRLRHALTVFDAELPKERREAALEWEYDPSGDGTICMSAERCEETRGAVFISVFSNPGPRSYDSAYITLPPDRARALGEWLLKQWARRP
jgi:hypothetical protein